MQYSIHFLSKRVGISGLKTVGEQGLKVRIFRVESGLLQIVSTVRQAVDRPLLDKFGTHI